MSGKKAEGIIVLVLGTGVFAASLLADVIGYGDNGGFGWQQTMGTIAGVVIMVVGFVLTLRAK